MARISMGDLRFLAMLANEGVEVVTVMLVHGLIPLFWANVKAVSLMLAWGVITLVYPFHGMATCLITHNFTEACALSFIMRSQRGNITHDILALQHAIHSGTADMTARAFEHSKTRVNALLNNRAAPPPDNRSFILELRR